MKKWYSLFFFFMPLLTIAQTQPLYFVEGKVSDLKGKAIKGAEIYIFSLKKTFLSDKKGMFLMGLPKGDYVTKISAENFKSKQLLISLKDKDTLLNIQLEPVFNGIVLQEVQIKGRNFDKLNTPRAGMERLEAQTVDKMPSFLGERDAVKALQLLPGIVGTTEGSAEMNVRAGGNDQNLMVLDKIPLYSSTHLFGIYSAFNPLAVAQTNIYKGDFPAYLGGKLSSVSLLNSTDTLTQKISAIAELGVASAKAHISIPLFAKKSTLYLSGRRSYYDYLLKLFSRGRADVFTFQDYNLTWLYQPNEKNKLKLSWYHEQDAAGTTDETLGLLKGDAYKSQNAYGLNWKHQFNQNLYNETMVYYTDYSSLLSEEKRTSDHSYLYQFKTSIYDLGFSNTLNYSTSNHHFFGGVDFIRHKFTPTKLWGEEYGKSFYLKNIDSSFNNDISFFVGLQSDFQWGGKLNLGLRNNYYVGNNQRFSAFEPRVSYFQNLSENTALKVAYSRMTQPIHRLNNPGLGLPQDVILSSGSDILPQRADHFSLEMVKHFKFDEEQFSFSIQPFHKRLNNIVNFRDGYDTRSLMYGNTYSAKGIKELVTAGQGQVWGVEIMLEKKTGKLNGWLSYTLMKASHKFAELNDGIAFAPMQDRRHNLNLVANWQVSPKWNIGFAWSFISGQPINVPSQVFLFPRVNYAEETLNINPKDYLFEQAPRGSYRMKTFHKLDITSEYKFKLLGMNATWNLGAYNIYNRINPSFYYMGKSEATDLTKSQPVLKAVSLFPLIPSSSFRVQF